MIRARVVRHQCVPVTTPCRFYGSGVFAATLPLRIINNSSTTPIYYNPYTWPSDWTAVEIAAHLRSHLKPNAALKYPPLETMLKERNIPAIELAIRDWIEPPPRSASSDANAVTADAIDPQTWPPDWNTTDIKNLLSNHLINPNKVPNYALLITQRAAGEFEAIKDELWRYIPSPVIDPFNPYTWPRKPNARWNATDIENCLHNQVVPSPSLDFCKSLEAMLKDDKIDALSRELQDYIDEAEKTTKKLIKRNTTAKYYNPYTWPKNWEAADIKNHLNDFLIPNAQPLDYKSLETMLKGNKIATVTREIRDFIKPPPPTKTHTSAEFAKHYDPYSWPRNWNTTDIENLLSEHLKNPKEFTNYALLVTQLANGEFEALEKELKTYLKTGQSTEISFRAEAMKVFSTKFSKKFSFPKTIEAMEPVIKYLYKLFYPGNVVPSFYDALTQVFTRSDTYKDLSWFQKAKQDFARLGAAISDLPKLFNLSIVKPILRLTKLKLEYESVLYPMVLFAINATRKVQYTVHQFLVDEFLPPGQEKMSFRAFVAFLIKEKELESQRHIEYERAIESSSSPSSKTRSTRKMTSTETVKDCGEYQLCLPKELNIEASDVQYLVTNSNSRPKLPLSETPKTPSSVKRWIRFPACEANVETFVNTSEYFSDLHQRLKTLSEGEIRKRVLYMMGWMFSWDMRLVPSEKESTLRHHITKLKEKGVEIRILFWQLRLTDHTSLGVDLMKTYWPLTEKTLRSIGLKEGRHFIGHSIDDPESWLCRRIYSHHQKHITILDGDNLTSYCGGSDVAVGRYDDHEKVIFRHELSNTVRFDTSLEYGGSVKRRPKKRTKFDRIAFKSGEPRLAWQDVQFRVDGQAALNIARTFEHFFGKALAQIDSDEPCPELNVNIPMNATSTTPIAQIVDDTNKPKNEHDPSTAGNPPTAEEKKKRLPIVQIIDARKRKLAFEEAMIQLISKATKSIYIEQQYFQGRLDFKDTPRNQLRNHVPLAIVAKILEIGSLRKKSGLPLDFEVRIVLPLIPDAFLNLESSVTEHTLHLHHQTKESMVNHITSECESDPQKYPEDLVQCLKFCYLSRDIGGKSYPVYIHSKVMIVDEAVCAIGSANINDRSMMPHKDTEMAAIIISKDVAKDLQERLDKEHKPFLKRFPSKPNEYPLVGYYEKRGGKFDLRGRNRVQFSLFPQLLG